MWNDGFFNFASKLCGSLAGVCAILAVLAVPSTAWADDLTECQDCCAGQIDPEMDPAGYNDCVNSCMQGTGACGFASQCPSKIQNKKYLGCVNAGLKCDCNGSPSTCQDSKNKSLCTCCP